MTDIELEREYASVPDVEPPPLKPLQLTGSQRFQLWGALHLARYYAPDAMAREQFEAALEVLEAKAPTP